MDYDTQRNLMERLVKIESTNFLSQNRRFCGPCGSGGARNLPGNDDAFRHADRGSGQ